MEMEGLLMMVGLRAKTTNVRGPLITRIIRLGEARV